LLKPRSCWWSCRQVQQMQQQQPAHRTRGDSHCLTALLRVC
jgi:hypothetical protein